MRLLRTCLVREGILSVERRANDPSSQVHDEDSGRPIDVPTMHDENSKINFELMQRIGYRSRIHFELVVGSVLSSEQNHDLVRLNPFLTRQKFDLLPKRSSVYSCATFDRDRLFAASIVLVRWIHCFEIFWNVAQPLPVSISLTEEERQIRFPTSWSWKRCLNRLAWRKSGKRAGQNCAATG